MLIFKFALLSIVIICILISAVFFAIWLIFAKFPNQVGSTLAFIKRVKHQKDVPARHDKVIKDLSTGTYTYTVRKKVYKIKSSAPCKPGELKKMRSVEYLKICPKISRFKDIGEVYGVYALFSLLSASLFLIMFFTI